MKRLEKKVSKLCLRTLFTPLEKSQQYPYIKVFFYCYLNILVHKSAEEMNMYNFFFLYHDSVFAYTTSENSFIEYIFMKNLQYIFHAFSKK